MARARPGRGHLTVDRPPVRDRIDPLGSTCSTPAVSDLETPLLLTPGPLSTPPEVRAALARDWGSRDPAFVALSERVRARLVEILDVDTPHTAIPLQGSGTFAVEAMLQTFVPPGGKALVLVNGAYGRRMQDILRYAGRAFSTVERGETTPVTGEDVAAALAADPAVTHVLAVHCETTTGLLNPLADIAAATSAAGRKLLIDAMSAFGALPTPGPFEAVAASSNKCLEGVPGLGFVLCPTAAIEAQAGHARCLSLDLHAQWTRLQQDGQWRFTPPTHVLAGLDAALDVHRRQGGLAGRGARYRANCEVLVAGMRGLGFETLLPDALQAPIIVTFREPAHPNYSFSAFYDGLLHRGFAIYPGKLSEAPSFRVGCIGAVTPEDMQSFLRAVEATLAALGIDRLHPFEDTP